MARPSGFVFRLEKTRGPSWWAKYRLPDGTQVKRKIGPAWTGRGRPADGYFTKRLAEDWLHDRLEEVRRGLAAAAGRRAGATRALAGAGVDRAGVTFADAAAEYLRFSEQDRGCKPSTVRNYRNAINVHLLPVFGEMALEDITVQEIERWRAGMSSARQQRELSNKTKNNLLVLMHAIFRRAVKLYGLPANPVASVDRFRVRSSGDIQVFSPEEVWASSAPRASEADAAIFLTAAFTGLRRGELLGAALARRRLRRLDDQGPRELRRRAADDAEVRQGPRRADGARRRERARPARRPGALHRRRRLRVRRRGRAPARRRRAQQPVSRRARAGRATAACGSTI